jgi:hypothetical protein
MIGRKVRVFWPVDGTWYTGTVDKFDETSGEHLLIYPDGDSEWVKIGETASQDPEQPNDKTAAMLAHMEAVAAAAGAGAYGPYGPSSSGYPPNYPPHPFGGGGPPPGMPPYGMFPPPGYGMYPPPPPGDKLDHQHLHHHDYVTDYSNNNNSNKNRKHGPKAWTKEEDALLLNIVKNMQMPMKWSIVAQSLPDRTGKQCRERYVNHLNPRLKVTDWNALEDAMIFHLYNSMGSHWAKMSKIIPGRTDNGIKNRFHNLRRQYEREDEHRLRLSASHEFKEAIRMDRMRKFPEAMEGTFVY